MDVPIDQECITKKIQEIRGASSNWNLKGDKALLNVLETIHKDVISKVNQTNDKYEAQLDELNRACVSLMNVNNRLSGLCNTQFVENKVQEDDVVIIKEDKNIDDSLIIDKSHQSIENKIENKENEELKIKERIYSAVAKSLKALEGLCEEINISSDTESGSENDDNDLGYSVVLKPKDIYTKKRLPYIIGTQKWKNKSHIGLQECSSESEDENQIQSENEADLSSSGESSDGDLSPRGRMIEKKATMNLPIPKPIFTDNQSANSSSTHNSSDTVDSEAIKKILVHDNRSTVVAETLPTQDPAPQTLVKPSDFAAELARKLGTPHNIQQPVVDKIDKIPKAAPRSIDKDMTPKSLFDPVLSNKPTSRVTGNIFLDEPPPIDSKEEIKPSIFNDDDYISSGLFGDDAPGGLFKSSQSYQDFNKSKPTHAGLFDDVPDDDDLFSVKKTEKVKTPISNVEPVKKIEKINQPSSLNVKKTIVSDNKSKINKGLFDDSDNSDDNIFNFSNKSKSKVTVNKQDNDDFFASAKQKEVPKKNITKASKLFDDLSDSDDDLFGSKKIFKKVTSTPQRKDDIIKRDTKVEIPNSQKPKVLIDEKVKIKIQDQITVPLKNEKEIISVVSEKTEVNNIPGIFDDLPPPLNKDLSENISQEENIFDNVTGLVETNKSLFDEHPPPLTKDTIKKDNIFAHTKKSKNIANEGLFVDVPPPLNKDIAEDNIFEDIKEVTNNVLNKVLFDDLPPPLNKDSSASSSPQDDIFANIKGLRETNTSTEGLFDEPPVVSSHNVNIFSDEPPEYMDEPPEIEDNIFKIKDDTFEDYPYFKTINKIDTKSKIPDDKSTSTMQAKEKIKSGLFSDSEDDLFSVKEHIKKKSEPIIKKVSLFDDTSDDDQLFSVPKKENEEKVVSSSHIVKPKSKISSLFQDPEPQIDTMSTTRENEKKMQSKSKISDLFQDSEPQMVENVSGFKSVPKTEKLQSNIENPRSKISSLFQDSEPHMDILTAEENDGGCVSVPKIEKLQSSIEKPESKINSLFQDLESQMNITPTVEENDPGCIGVPKIGKLQSNININVKALMGATNITVSNIKKSVSDLKPIESTTNIADNHNIIKESITIKSVSFDDDPRSSDSTLRNDIIKDRVKIQVKRRPSSRKARHEAARLSVADIYNDTSRNSGKDFTSSLPSSPTRDLNKNSIPEFDIVKASSSIEVHKTVSKSDSKPEVVSKSTIISEAVIKPDTKAEAISKISAKTEAVTKNVTINKSEAVSKSKNTSKLVKAKDIFFDDSDDSDLFFVNKKSKNNLEDIFKSESSKVESKGAIKKKTQSNKVFDSDSDSDLFTSTKKSSAPLKKQSKKESKSLFVEDADDLFKTPVKTTAPVPIKISERKTKSLFDDDEDEIEDLFRMKKDADKSKTNKATIKVNKPSIIKKTSVLTTSDAPFEDPLSSFLKD